MPITTSLLDADFYKFTMTQVIRKHHAGVPVKFAFTNRTKLTEPLAKVIDLGRLREELEHVRTLSLSRDELDYLRTCPGYPPGLFSESYLQFLATLRLPPITVGVRGDALKIESVGEWAKVTFWETIVLNIVNELYFEELRHRDGLESNVPGDVFGAIAMHGYWQEGLRRLRRKIGRIRKVPSAQIIEFGNRRRHSGGWHEIVLEELINGLPRQLLGTSNVRLARKYGILPKGTFAHEMYMCYAAVAQSHGQNIVKSHGQVLKDWRAEYGDQLSVALTDTFGSEFFFRDADEDTARQWTWLRHDSGDPFAFGERAIAFYQSFAIDPRDKGIVYSDGLTVEVIEKLVERFNGRIDLAFGWGTDLTNDLGYNPLSLVMKAVEARGYDTVKLSDNPAKATGPADVVGLYKHLFQYEEGVHVECKY